MVTHRWSPSAYRDCPERKAAASWQSVTYNPGLNPTLGKEGRVGGQMQGGQGLPCPYHHESKCNQRTSVSQAFFSVIFMVTFRVFSHLLCLVWLNWALVHFPPSCSSSGVKWFCTGVDQNNRTKAPLRWFQVHIENQLWSSAFVVWTWINLHLSQLQEAACILGWGKFHSSGVHYRLITEQSNLVLC